MISDYLNRGVESENVEVLIANALPQVDRWLLERERFRVDKELEFSAEEKREIETLVTNGRFTITMENELKNLLIYYKLSGKNLMEILRKYREIEIVDKRDSKKILEEIRGVI